MSTTSRLGERIHMYEHPITFNSITMTTIPIKYGKVPLLPGFGVLDGGGIVDAIVVAFVSFPAN